MEVKQKPINSSNEECKIKEGKIAISDGRFSSSVHINTGVNVSTNIKLEKEDKLENEVDPGNNQMEENRNKINSPNEQFMVKKETIDIPDAGLCSSLKGEVKDEIFHSEFLYTDPNSYGGGAHSSSQIKTEVNVADIKLEEEDKPDLFHVENENIEPDEFETEGTAEPEAMESEGTEQEMLAGNKTSSSKTNKSVTSKKRRRSNESVEASKADQALGFLKNVTSNNELKGDECGVYGQHLAHKLRRYSKQTRAVVQHLINNIVFSADMGQHGIGSE